MILKNLMSFPNSSSTKLENLSFTHNYSNSNIHFILWNWILRPFVIKFISNRFFDKTQYIKYYGICSHINLAINWLKYFKTLVNVQQEFWNGSIDARNLSSTFKIWPNTLKENITLLDLNFHVWYRAQHIQ